MYQSKTDKSLVFKQSILLLLAGLVSAAVVFVLTPKTNEIGATTAAQLQSAIDAIEAEQEQNEATLAQISAEVDSLQNKIAQLNVEISQIESEIEKTELKIEKLTIELELAEAELKRQKGILAENLRTLYIEGNVSTLDLILASDNFSDFINRQEYLSRLKNSVQDSTKKVIELKAQIEINKQEQEELLTKQEKQRQGLKETRSEQNELLSATQGQESLYQGIVADLEAQYEQALQELEDFLVNQTFTSQGPVNKGDVIGFMGNTGFSTGVHLHLGVRQGGQFGTWIDPQQSGTTLINGYLWPTESTRITAVFGASGCSEYICGGTHFGLDIGGVVAGVPGDLVYAIDDGEILHRGFLGSSGLGYFVIIDHGNNWSYYGHLQAQ